MCAFLGCSKPILVLCAQTQAHKHEHTEHHTYTSNYSIHKHRDVFLWRVKFMCINRQVGFISLQIFSVSISSSLSRSSSSHLSFENIKCMQRNSLYSPQTDFIFVGWPKLKANIDTYWDSPKLYAMFWIEMNGGKNFSFWGRMRHSLVSPAEIEYIFSSWSTLMNIYI